MILARSRSFEFRLFPPGFRNRENFKMTKLRDIVIAVKGAGEMASGVAWRLYTANLRKIVMLETDAPLAVRREVERQVGIVGTHLFK